MVHEASGNHIDPYILSTIRKILFILLTTLTSHPKNSVGRGMGGYRWILFKMTKKNGDELHHFCAFVVNFGKDTYIGIIIQKYWVDDSKLLGIMDICVSHNINEFENRILTACISLMTLQKKYVINSLYIIWLHLYFLVETSCKKFEM